MKDKFVKKYGTQQELLDHSNLGYMDLAKNGKIYKRMSSYLDKEDIQLSKNFLKDTIKSI